MRIFCTSRISWNKTSDWLPIVFHFGTEKWEEQLKKHPVELTKGIDDHIEYRLGIEIELDLNGLIILVLHLRLCEWFWLCMRNTSSGKGTSSYQWYNHIQRQPFKRKHLSISTRFDNIITRCQPNLKNLGLAILVELFSLSIFSKSIFFKSRMCCFWDKMTTSKRTFISRPDKKSIFSLVLSHYAIKRRIWPPEKSFNE